MQWHNPHPFFLRGIDIAQNDTQQNWSLQEEPIFKDALLF